MLSLPLIRWIRTRSNDTGAASGSSGGTTAEETTANRFRLLSPPSAMRIPRRREYVSCLTVLLQQK